MKRIIQQEIKAALVAATIATDFSNINVDYTKDKSHGDFSSNIALQLAKPLKKQPRQIAEQIVAHLNLSNMSSIIKKVEIAGPGFINFFLKGSVWYPIIEKILTQGEHFGASDQKKDIPILVEFVSANPTGPLHVGHGRGAAYGDSLVRILKTIGYRVYAEYYVNDAGRQIDILVVSVWLRYLEAFGGIFTFPENAYKGNYISNVAEKIIEKYGKDLYRSPSSIFSDIPSNECNYNIEEKEAHIDALVLQAKKLLGNSNYQKLIDISLNHILDDIKEDLTCFKVNFDNWFSENSLFKNGIVDKTIERLKNNGYTYEDSGALWFKSTDFGDDKDRVLIRENGHATYFAADAAYRLSILESRGFKKMINILGADHHGYITRISAVIQALGYPADSLKVILVQFAVLYRGSKKLQMSTRSGEFVTIKALRKEVGSDAARFFYVLRRVEQHMDFDLELAKNQSNTNPVYYVQYVYARISSVFDQLKVKNLNWDRSMVKDLFVQLKEEQEINLLILLNRYPEILEQAAQTYEPHLIAHYLRDLAQEFHVYYNKHVFLVENISLRTARLSLIKAIQQTIKNGLSLLGVATMEKM